MNTMSTDFSRQEIGPGPLVVSPKRAATMLDVGLSTLYQLLGSGELEHYLDGKFRRITTASIHDYIARRVAGEPSGRPASRAARRAVSTRLTEKATPSK